VKPIATVLGELLLLEGACEQQIKAELRGLTLLIDIVNHSPNWDIESESGKPFLISRDGPPGILVDIFESMKARILGGDPHLCIYMAMKLVCVSKKGDEVLTPATDSMVSLVLLGNMGWPMKQTPRTLKEKALTQNEKAREYITEEVYFNQYDDLAIENSRIDYDAGKHMSAIAHLAAMARRWYVCRSWPFEKIRPLIAEHLANFDPQHIQRYIEAPEFPDDDLFIEL
jgi:hypothetical protein